MIVNPQLFNYRLIKGSLVFAVAVFAVLGYIKYQSIESQNVSLKQENKLIANELSQTITHNDVISGAHNGLLLKFEAVQDANEAALDSITQLTQQLSVMSKYKTQNLDLKKQLSSSTRQIEQVRQTLKTVEHTWQQANAQLAQQSAELSILKNGVSSSNYNHLSANYISVKGFETSLNARAFSTKAKKINNLEVCFNLAEDSEVKAGAKAMFIQIINPDNNVVADKGMVKFKEQSLIYSYKTTVEYINKHTTVCTAIEVDNNDKPLKKGNYKINVFNDDYLVGSTTIYLD